MADTAKLNPAAPRTKGWRRLRRRFRKGDALTPGRLIAGTPLDEVMVCRLRREGKLPVYALPTADIAKGNGNKQVFLAEYENGVELTVVFDDEDRPSAVTDAVYDAIRKPLFGRSEDIESHFINGASPESLDFPGTYAADFDWNAAAPLHGTATVPIDRFEQRGGPVVWVNTWSHLFGEANANPAMDMAFYSAAAGPPEEAAAASPSSLRPSGVSVDSQTAPFVTRRDSEQLPAPPAEGGIAPPSAELSYPLYHGSRDDVDRRFKGLLKSFASTMTPEKKAMLGARLNRPPPLSILRSHARSLAKAAAPPVVAFTVTAEMTPGGTVKARAPDGTTLQVTVPLNASPGDEVEFALPQRPARSLPADKPKSLADIAVSLTATTPDAMKAAE